MSAVHKVLQYASHTEFRRFFWAGSFAFAVDFSLLVLLTEVAGVNYLWSNLVAVSGGTVTSYLLCITWVFNTRRYNKIVLEFPIFISLSLVGLALNELLLWLCVAFAGIHYLASKIIVTLTVFVMNFFLKKVLLFRS